MNRLVTSNCSWSVRRRAAQECFSKGTRPIAPCTVKAMRIVLRRSQQRRRQAQLDVDDVAEQLALLVAM